MAVNQVVVDGEAVLDLSGDSVTPQTMLAGATAHNAAGDQIEGALVVTEISRAVVTLTTSGWSAGSDYSYVQSASVSGMTASTEFDYDPSLTGTDEESDIAVVEAFTNVIFAGGGDGIVTFKATDAPGVNIPVIVRLFA